MSANKANMVTFSIPALTLKLLILLLIVIMLGIGVYFKTSGAFFNRHNQNCVEINRRLRANMARGGTITSEMQDLYTRYETYCSGTVTSSWGY